MSKIESQNAPEPVGLYPHARQVGNFLFLSGIGPRERGKKEIPGVELDQNGNIISYDIEIQCHSVFKNVRSVLEDAGSNWDNLIDVMVFLTNMKDDFDIFNKDIFNKKFNSFIRDGESLMAYKGIVADLLILKNFEGKRSK